MEQISVTHIRHKIMVYVFFFIKGSKTFLYLFLKKMLSISIRWKIIKEQEQKYLAELLKNRDSYLGK